MLDDAIRQFLSQYPTYVVASMGETPWIATMYFADDGTYLYSAIKGDSITLRHLRTQPRVAFAVNGPRPDLFMQGLGIGEDLGPFEQFPFVRELLERKAPEIRRFLDNVPKLHALRIKPTDFYITDHRQRISDRVHRPADA
jgi:hypothetical protein